jgi:hypothetical protein
VDFIAVNNFGDTREGGLAGPMGAFIITLLAIATVLLIRNMNKRLRRLPDSFEDAEAARRAEEIARLDAAMHRPSGGPLAPEVDEDRSRSAGPAGEPQVSSAEPPDGPDPADQRTERA